MTGTSPTPASTATTASAATRQWTPEQANEWYEKQPWFVGANFGPRTAINQLEMWQADSFDPKTIDQELGWAKDLGFNSMRVFLHHLLWEQDADGLLKRMDEAPPHIEPIPPDSPLFGFLL